MTQDTRSNGTGTLAADVVTVPPAIAEAALEHDCPTCPAKAGKRCGWYQEPPDNPGYRQVRRWHHRANAVHPERSAMLNGTEEKAPLCVTTYTDQTGGRSDLLPAIASDLQDQLAEHSRRTLMRHHRGGEAMEWSETAVLDFAERFKPLATALHDVAFFVADQLFDGIDKGKPGDGGRTRVAHLIADHLECSLSTAHNALQAAELGRRLPVDKVGTPSVQQLLTIVWVKIKGQEARGWDRVTAWMIRKGFRFEDTTCEALKDYCERIKADAEAHERDLEFKRTHGDPHEPADADVIEEVDAEPVAAADEPEPDDEELRDWRRKQHAMAEVYGLLDTAEAVVNVGEIPDGYEDLRKCLARIDHLAELVERLRAKATPDPSQDWDELPL
jgi:hypothetical protein